MKANVPFALDYRRCPDLPIRRAGLTSRTPSPSCTKYSSSSSSATLAWFLTHRQQTQNHPTNESQRPPPLDRRRRPELMTRTARSTSRTPSPSPPSVSAILLSFLPSNYINFLRPHPHKSPHQMKANDPIALDDRRFPDLPIQISRSCCRPLSPSPPSMSAILLASLVKIASKFVTPELPLPPHSQRPLFSSTRPRD